jgi:hypothetical protein
MVELQDPGEQADLCEKGLATGMSMSVEMQQSITLCCLCSQVTGTLDTCRCVSGVICANSSARLEFSDIKELVIGGILQKIELCETEILLHC